MCSLTCRRSLGSTLAFLEKQRCILATVSYQKLLTAANATLCLQSRVACAPRLDVFPSRCAASWPQSDREESIYRAVRFLTGHLGAWSGYSGPRRRTGGRRAGEPRVGVHDAQLVSFSGAQELRRHIPQAQSTSHRMDGHPAGTRSDERQGAVTRPDGALQEQPQNLFLVTVPAGNAPDRSRAYERRSTHALWLLCLQPSHAGNRGVEAGPSGLPFPRPRDLDHRPTLLDPPGLVVADEAKKHHQKDVP